MALLGTAAVRLVSYSALRCSNEGLTVSHVYSRRRRVHALSSTIKSASRRARNFQTCRSRGAPAGVDGARGDGRAARGRRHARHSMQEFLRARGAAAMAPPAAVSVGPAGMVPRLAVVNLLVVLRLTGVVALPGSASTRRGAGCTVSSPTCYLDDTTSVRAPSPVERART